MNKKLFLKTTLVFDTLEVVILAISIAIFLSSFPRKDATAIHHSQTESQMASHQKNGFSCVLQQYDSSYSFNKTLVLSLQNTNNTSIAKWACYNSFCRQLFLNSDDSQKRNLTGELFLLGNQPSPTLLHKFTVDTSKTAENYFFSTPDLLVLGLDTLLSQFSSANGRTILSSFEKDVNQEVSRALTLAGQRFPFFLPNQNKPEQFNSVFERYAQPLTDAGVAAFWRGYNHHLDSYSCSKMEQEAFSDWFLRGIAYVFIVRVLWTAVKLPVMFKVRHYILKKQEERQKKLKPVHYREEEESVEELEELPVKESKMEE